MSLDKYVTIRTGAVLFRKQAPSGKSHYIYRSLSLKNVTEDGQILLDEIENYYAAEQLKKEYISYSGDVLLRLSSPYTAILITEKEEDLLVPSHFAIIRIRDNMVNPYYLHWWLGKNRKQFCKIASGGAIMGTISSGYIAKMAFEPPPLETQGKIEELLRLANREWQLLSLLVAKKKNLIDVALDMLISNYKEK
jgi:restriction endonuclease S subunit